MIRRRTGTASGEIQPAGTISKRTTIFELTAAYFTLCVQIHIPFTIRLGGLCCLSLLISCSPPLPPPSETERKTANAALELLSKNQTNEIYTAFEEIVDWSYIRHERTENRSAQNYESYTHAVKVDPASSTEILIGPDSIALTDLSGLINAMVPVDPPYLTERFKDEFSYAIQEDTIYWSRPAYEIRIQARSGSTQGKIMASHIYDAASHKLIAANLYNFNSTVLFEESSRYQFQLQPIGTTWVPYRLNAQVTLNLPFGREQVFTRNVTFYNYTAPPAN